MTLVRRLTPPLTLLALLALPAGAQEPDPFGDCCVAKVSMKTYDSWEVACGDCAENPGIHLISQPDPEKNLYVDGKGLESDSPYDLALKICRCPSLDKQRAMRKALRTFHGE